MKSRLKPILAAALLATALLPAIGQTAPAPSAASAAEPFEGLMRRIEQLEAKARRVDALESQIKELKARAGEPAVEAAVPVESWPKVHIQVLGHVNYHFSDMKSEKNSFLLGELATVTTVKLNEQAGVLTDIHLTSTPGGLEVELGRLYASYRFNDNFKLDVGRFNTAIGWYNSFYNNGSYYQTAVGRPAMQELDDLGGALPVRSNGVALSGEIPSGKHGLSYTVAVTNGRKYSFDEGEATAIADDNDFKAVNVQLRAKPEWAPNWSFGVGAYRDILTPVLDPAGQPGVRTHIDQLIYSIYAVYKSSLVEWFTEAAFVGNQVRGDPRRWTSMGYTQASRKLGPVRPYARMQWQNGPENDPVFSLAGTSGLIWGPQVGVRYDFTSLMAVKFEYGRTERTKAGVGEGTNEFTTQLTFRF